MIHSEHFKGHTIEIHSDETHDSPDDWGDNNLFLVGYHRDFTITRNDIITKATAQEVFRLGCVPKKPRKNADNGQGAAFLGLKYHFFPLEAYIHSGVRLALGGEGHFPDRQWDVSLLGLVCVAKAEWRRGDTARAAPGNLMLTWNCYLTGDVYGYIINKFDDQQMEDIGIVSCWGFYGDYNKDGGALNEAKLTLKEKKA